MIAENNELVHLLLALPTFRAFDTIMIERTIRPT
jgi:hypothetical protein